jgi:hypothetical protein
MGAHAVRGPSSRLLIAEQARALRHHVAAVGTLAWTNGEPELSKLCARVMNDLQPWGRNLQHAETNDQERAPIEWESGV